MIKPGIMHLPYVIFTITTLGSNPTHKKIIMIFLSHFKVISFVILTVYVGSWKKGACCCCSPSETYGRKQGACRDPCEIRR